VDRGGPTGEGRTQGIAPGPIGERQDLQPLASRFFLTAAYRDYEPASAAAQRLRDQGLATARPRQMDLRGETLFGLVVYFDGDDAGARVREALFGVTAPDATFESYRNRQAGWPNEGSLQ